MRKEWMFPIFFAATVSVNFLLQTNAQNELLQDEENESDDSNDIDHITNQSILEANNNLYFPHEAYCHLVYGFDGRKVMLLTCKKGEMFHAKQLKCMKSKEVKCGKRKKPKKTDSSSSNEDDLPKPFICPEDGGHFPHKHYCHFYYDCYLYPPRLMMCRSGLLFDSDSETCNYRKNVDCEGRVDPYEDRDDEISGESTKTTITTTRPTTTVSTTKPTTKPTTQTPKIDQLCLQPFGIFPYPTDCKKFVRCWFYNSYIDTCPAGTLYDAMLFRCRDYRFVYCNNRKNPYGDVTTTQKPRPKFSCPSWNGIYPHETNCGSFYVCMWGYFTPRNCPKGELYDVRYRRCMQEEIVICGDRVHPDDEDESSQDEIIDKNPNFVCKQNHGRFTHEDYCHWYYNCRDGKPSLRECRNGKYFDYRRRKCYEPKDVSCQNRKKPEEVTTPTPEVFVCPEDGKFPHENNCAQYYECKNRRHILKECPEGKLFDDSGMCKDEDDVNCGIRIHPSDDPAEKPDVIVDPNPNFKCQTRHGRYKHENCDWYFHCKDKIATTRECSKGKYYDYRKRKCLHTSEVDCENRKKPEDRIKSTTAKPIKTEATVPTTEKTTAKTEIPTTTERPFMCPSKDGKYPHEKDCGAFYDCKKGKVKLHDCPKKHLFDIKKRKCEPEHDVDCDDRIHPDDDPYTPQDKVVDPNPNFKCKERHGKHTNDKYCDWYYNCKDKKSSLRECKRGKYYDTKKRHCRNSEEVECHHREKPEEREKSSTEKPVKTEATIKTTEATATTAEAKKPTTEATTTTTEETTTTTEATTTTTKATTTTTKATTTTTKAITAATETPTTIKRPFVCPTKEGKYPHEKNCGAFYDCKKGKVKLHDCPKKHLFNAKKRKCEPEHDVDCDDRIHPDDDPYAPEDKVVDPNPNFKCKERHGRYTHDKYCDWYYSCKDKKSKVRECKKGQYYDTKKRRCTDSKEVECHDRAKPEERKPTKKTTIYRPTTPTSEKPTAVNSTHFPSTQTTMPKQKTTEDKETTMYTWTTDEIMTSTKFACPKDDDYFPHEKLCHMFYACENFEMHLIKCPSGQLFDVERKICDFEENVNCGDRRHPNDDPDDRIIDPEPDFDCNSRHGCFTHEKICKWYYYCHDKRAVLKECHGTTLFDSALSKCVDWWMVLCHNRTVEETTSVKPVTSPGKKTQTPLPSTTENASRKTTRSNETSSNTQSPIIVTSAITTNDDKYPKTTENYSTSKTGAQQTTSSTSGNISTSDENEKSTGNTDTSTIKETTLTNKEVRTTSGIRTETTAGKNTDETATSSLFTERTYTTNGKDKITTDNKLTRTAGVTITSTEVTKNTRTTENVATRTTNLSSSSGKTESTEYKRTETTEGKVTKITTATLPTEEIKSTKDKDQITTGTKFTAVKSTTPSTGQVTSTENRGTRSTQNDKTDKTNVHLTTPTEKTKSTRSESTKITVNKNTDFTSTTASTDERGNTGSKTLKTTESKSTREIDLTFSQITQGEIRSTSSKFTEPTESKKPEITPSITPSTNISTSTKEQEMKSPSESKNTDEISIISSTSILPRSTVDKETKITGGTHIYDTSFSNSVTEKTSNIYSSKSTGSGGDDRSSRVSSTTRVTGETEKEHTKFTDNNVSGSTTTIDMSTISATGSESTVNENTKTTISANTDMTSMRPITFSTDKTGKTDSKSTENETRDRSTPETETTSDSTREEQSTSSKNTEDHEKKSTEGYSTVSIKTKTDHTGGLTNKTTENRGSTITKSQTKTSFEKTGISSTTSFVHENKTTGLGSGSSSQTTVVDEITTSLINDTSVCGEEDGNYPDKADCSKFYICKDGLITLQKCPEGTLFDTVVKKCYREDWVNCGNREKPDIKVSGTLGSTTTELPISELCKTEDGNFHDPNDCRKYYVCKDGAFEWKECPNKMLFDNIMRTCFDENHVNCGDRTRPQTTIHPCEEPLLTSTAETTITPSTEQTTVNTISSGETTDLTKTGTGIDEITKITTSESGNTSFSTQNTGNTATDSSVTNQKSTETDTSSSTKIISESKNTGVTEILTGFSTTGSTFTEVTEKGGKSTASEEIIPSKEGSAQTDHITESKTVATEGDKIVTESPSSQSFSTLSTSETDNISDNSTTSMSNATFSEGNTEKTVDFSKGTKTTGFSTPLSTDGSTSKTGTTAPSENATQEESSSALSKKITTETGMVSDEKSTSQFFTTLTDENKPLTTNTLSEKSSEPEKNTSDANSTPKIESTLTPKTKFSTTGSTDRTKSTTRNNNSTPREDITSSDSENTQGMSKTTAGDKNTKTSRVTSSDKIATSATESIISDTTEFPITSEKNESTSEGKSSIPKDKITSTVESTITTKTEEENETTATQNTKTSSENESTLEASTTSSGKDSTVNLDNTSQTSSFPKTQSTSGKGTFPASTTVTNNSKPSENSTAGTDSTSVEKVNTTKSSTSAVKITDSEETITSERTSTASNGGSSPEINNTTPSQVSTEESTKSSSAESPTTTEDPCLTYTPKNTKPTGPPHTHCQKHDLDCIIDQTGDITQWFTCPSKYGIYPHPSSDGLFIRCKNWIPSAKKCGAGLIFSAEYLQCVDPDDAQIVKKY